MRACVRACVCACVCVSVTCYLVLIVSNTHAQVVRAQSCANHVQHTERSSRATRCVPLGTERQLSI